MPISIIVAGIPWKGPIEIAVLDRHAATIFVTRLCLSRTTKYASGSFVQREAARPRARCVLIYQSNEKYNIRIEAQENKCEETGENRGSYPEESRQASQVTPLKTAALPRYRDSCHAFQSETLINS